jgi:hypothetical protein
LKPGPSHHVHRLLEVNSAHCLKAQFHHVPHKDIARASCEALAWGLLQVSLQQEHLTMLVDLLSEIIVSS